jgi:glycosyltransferase involved in cell wall biosynthesis
MNICLVSAFPPSREALNEYGYHLALELQEIPGLSLTILADDLPQPQSELHGFSVVRCWAFNSLANPWRLLRAIRQLKPDVVWFNLGFASFGGKPLPAFAGIGIPAMARMYGFYTHVTLHQLMETVDLKDAGVRFPGLYRAAGFLATQLLLFANSISVLLPAYRSIIREKYGRGAVYVRNHGILSGRPEYPALSKRGNPEHRILAFGKWGTYKRLELMVEAFEAVAHKFPQARLIVGGTDHPKAPGYMESMARRCREHPQIEFIGYVPEDKIADLFQSTSIAVMPYSSSAGSSGVAHLACAYGVPIVASDIPDFRQLAEEEGLAIELYQAGKMKSLADTMIALLENPERQMEMAIQNFSAALRMSMPEIIRQYLRTFNLQQHLGLLASVSRLRRLPRWLPLRPRLARLAARRFLGRLPVSAPPASVTNPGLLDREGDQGRDVLIPGISVDRDLESSSRPNNSDGLSITDRAAREEDTAHQNERSRKQSLPHPLSSGPATGDGQPSYAEARQKQGVPPPAAVPITERQGGHASGNSQSGTDSLTSWSDRRRRERADGSGG